MGWSKSVHELTSFIKSSTIYPTKMKLFPASRVHQAGHKGIEWVFYLRLTKRSRALRLDLVGKHSRQSFHRNSFSRGRISRFQETVHYEMIHTSNCISPTTMKPPHSIILKVWLKDRHLQNCLYIPRTE